MHIRAWLTRQPAPVDSGHKPDFRPASPGHGRYPEQPRPPVVPPCHVAETPRLHLPAASSWRRAWPGLPAVGAPTDERGHPVRTWAEARTWSPRPHVQGQGESQPPGAGGRARTRGNCSGVRLPVCVRPGPWPCLVSRLTSLSGPRDRRVLSQRRHEGTGSERVSLCHKVTPGRTR